jgi:hypothetical protein
MSSILKRDQVYQPSAPKAEKGEPAQLISYRQLSENEIHNGGPRLICFLRFLAHLIDKSPTTGFPAHIRFFIFHFMLIPLPSVFFICSRLAFPIFLSFFSFCSSPLACPCRRVPLNDQQRDSQASIKRYARVRNIASGFLGRIESSVTYGIVTTLLLCATLVMLVIGGICTAHPDRTTPCGNAGLGVGLPLLIFGFIYLIVISYHTYFFIRNA